MLKQKRITADELEVLIEQAPLPLRYKISKVLYSIVGDKEAIDWVSGTQESRRAAIEKMINEALASGVTMEQLRRRAEGLNYLFLCLGSFIAETKRCCEGSRMVQ